ncbi:PREDICTED: dehydrogenase/reductase SDR family member 11-like [Wasmannia auropunctata]|uniref:dehydrogenase/reductase SDR family member 11-like n=1 Tax=Wasmannia auropunctata TaxID=64793 RepID=UPI0005F06254|nr:PREDICTED: dehydrogenase/reductase SDR family member 11-like [Wasmannia auropunctata]
MHVISHQFSWRLQTEDTQTIMLRWRGKTAVVTGAGSGIGEAITHALLQNGVNVTALDVRKERLANLDAECKQEGSRTLGTLRTICCDINREDEINEAFSQVETLGGVDIMVNNARIIRQSQIIVFEEFAIEGRLNV